MPEIFTPDCKKIFKASPVRVEVDPDPGLLLTRSKKEADPPLIRVLFDPTRRDFFDPKRKN